MMDVPFAHNDHVRFRLSVAEDLGDAIVGRTGRITAITRNGLRVIVTLDQELVVLKKKTKIVDVAIDGLLRVEDKENNAAT